VKKSKVPTLERGFVSGHGMRCPQASVDVAWEVESEWTVDAAKRRWWGYRVKQQRLGHMARRLPDYARGGA
jgi:hypothetical protein